MANGGTGVLSEPEIHHVQSLQFRGISELHLEFDKA
jgi:hypothetical protein